MSRFIQRRRLSVGRRKLIFAGAETTNNITMVADELDWRNLQDKNLIEIYRVLNRVDKLIDDLGGYVY